MPERWLLEFRSMQGDMTFSCVVRAGGGDEKAMDSSGNYFLCSVVEGFGTYGAEEDLLEIMGLLTPEEALCDSVAGFLTPENVFQRISEADKRRKDRWGDNA